MPGSYGGAGSVADQNATVEGHPPAVDQAHPDADRVDPAVTKAMCRNPVPEGGGTVDPYRCAVGEESRLHQVAGIAARDPGPQRCTCAPVPVHLTGAVAKL